MPTQFLLTKRLVTPAEKKELDRIAQENQCIFVRRSATHAVVKGWFEGPSLADDVEINRMWQILRSITALRIRYPLDE